MENNSSNKGLWFLGGLVIGALAYGVKKKYDEFKQVLEDAEGNIEAAVEQYFRDASEGAAAGQAAAANACEKTKPQAATQEDKPAVPESESAPQPEPKPEPASTEPEPVVAEPEPVLEPESKPEPELQTGSQPESQPEPESKPESDPK